MRFVRAIWKLLVGVKDALVLVAMLLFFGLLWAALSAGPQPIGDGVLLVELDGTLVEQPARQSASSLIAGGSSLSREHRLRDVVAAVDAAAKDDRVKAVALDLERFVGGGQSAIATLGEALDRARRAGKPVLAYATGYTDDSYQLAAHASEVWMNPLGAVAIAGPGGNNLYFKGLLDKLGVTANVYRVGTHKAAIEPYTRTDMSPEARANAQALASAMLETWRDDVRRARPAAGTSIDAYLRDPVAVIRAAGGDFARAALASKLIDRAGERHAFNARLTELGGKADDKRDPYRQIKMADYVRALDPGSAGGPIGVVTVAGTIVDGEAGPGTAGGDSIAKLIDEGVAGGKLKALVVRIDSPGGSVMASEVIRAAIVNAKAKGLPVVASMGNVAASGGYWVATPADAIFAEPSTITGSIGVFGILPSFQGSMAKLGLNAEGVKTTPLSGEPDLLNGPSPAAGALIQAGVESIYQRFLRLVAASRGKSLAEVDRLAQGRVWDGGTARQLGLVDQFGGLDEAIAKAAALAKSDDVSVTYLDQSPSFEDRLVEMLAGGGEAETAPGDAFAALAPAPTELLARVVGEVTAIMTGPSIQVRCIECPPGAVASPGPQALRWWRLLSAA
ncbi:MAG: signal peptide peptidase SppA [Pseudomonadota bacterium]|nr:signal peptide peptidase SppA [Pseudomonadota bacterium]